MEIPTIRIKSDNPLGYAIVNESDYDPDIHELYDQDPTGYVSSCPSDEVTPEPKQRKRRNSVETES